MHTQYKLVHKINISSFFHKVFFLSFFSHFSFFSRLRRRRRQCYNLIIVFMRNSDYITIKLCNFANLSKLCYLFLHWLLLCLFSLSYGAKAWQPQCRATRCHFCWLNCIIIIRLRYRIPIKNKYALTKKKKKNEAMRSCIKCNLAWVSASASERKRIE